MLLALGMAIGPLIGGGFAVSDWRWIFWYNLPLGGTCGILAFFVVKNSVAPVHRTWAEHAKRFDFVGT